MCGIYAVFGEYDTEESIRDSSTIQHRGPDNTHRYTLDKNNTPGLIVFHRLSIMDPTSAGNQPFIGPTWTLVCNGEIYNAEELRQKYLSHVPMKSSSDCEVIWQLLEQKIFSFSDMVRALYGVYAIIAVEHHDDSSYTVHAARDRVGIRPLYMVHTSTTLAFASEPCALNRYGSKVVPFPPDTAGYVLVHPTKNMKLDSTKYMKSDYEHSPFSSFFTTKTQELTTAIYSPGLTSREDAVRAVRTVLENVVRVRMMSDRPMACMLSGGVDSSTVAALVAKFSDHPIHTFSIGMEGSTDLAYARIMADHIHSIHHEIILAENDFISAVPEVIQAIQSYDVTSVRASTPMYLLSKYIRKNTDFKVIFSGEGPDEVCGSYMYFHASPGPDDSAQECRRLVKDMHYFDVLRADRCTAHWGLEVRVPLLGVDFIQTYWSIDPELRVPYQNMEKWVLRKAAEDLLPSSVAWRPKEAFSDGFSSQKRSWFKILQEYVEDKVTDEELESSSTTYPHHTPRTKEAYWIRQTYDQFYPGMDHLIPYQWLPRWVGDVKDPSARVLKQYKQN